MDRASKAHEASEHQRELTVSGRASLRCNRRRRSRLLTIGISARNLGTSYSRSEKKRTQRRSRTKEPPIFHTLGRIDARSSMQATECSREMSEGQPLCSKSRERTVLTGADTSRQPRVEWNVLLCSGVALGTARP